MTDSPNFSERAFPWQMVGPIALLAAFALAACGSIAADLAFLGCAGLFLSARLQIKGCVFSLTALTLAGILSHALADGGHLWRLGIELSFACSFFITALAFERAESDWAFAHSQLEAQQSAIHNLEEELASLHAASAERQMVSSAKIEEFQKRLEEVESDKSSLEMLNDVLRKANAGHYSEQKALAEEALQDKQRLAQILLTIEEQKQEIAQLKATGAATENRNLLNQLNAVRVEHEQARLINEALVRLHAKESLRACEAEAELRQHREQGLALESSEPHERAARQEPDSLPLEGGVSQAFIKEPGALVEELAQAEKKIQALAQVEGRYQQLRHQFEEKNRILHETRRLLFHAETDLQTLRIEKDQEALQEDLVSSDVCQVLSAQEREISGLQDENGELERLITCLTRLGAQPSLEEILRESLVPKRKKKPKKPVQQDLLF